MFLLQILFSTQAQEFIRLYHRNDRFSESIPIDSF